MAKTRRDPGKEHFPPYPGGFTFLRILQLLFAILELGLAGFALSKAQGAGLAFVAALAVVTAIVNTWIVSAHCCAPRAYNYWAVLVFEMLFLLFWLIATALLALAAVGILAYDHLYPGSCYNGLCLGDFKGKSSTKAMQDLYAVFDVLGPVLAAAAGVAAIQFLFYFISLLIHSIVVCKHRRAGMHSKPVKAGSGNNAMFPMKTQYAPINPQDAPAGHQDTAYNPNAPYGYNAAVPQNTGYTSPTTQHTGYSSPAPQNTGYSSPAPQNTGYYAPPPTTTAYPTQTYGDVTDVKVAPTEHSSTTGAVPYQSSVSPASSSAAYVPPPYAAPAYQPPASSYTYDPNSINGSGNSQQPYQPPPPGAY
ncbi:unnamed protein product [Clonostachys byssicola]|uniref:MARVEL domain-containing protein n=1 Tax=Clonostachys byssicola TaxID=160290 RepID=A0A9N9U969_9HYPO|nr:unnamed protein product [Clonostachys byssicola]